MAKVSVNGERKVVARRIKRLRAHYHNLFASTPTQSWAIILKDRYLSLEHEKSIELARRDFS